jgi:putative acetyltransferase
MLTIRSEHPDDFKPIYDLNALVFGTETEAALVDRLREEAGLILSLVAVYENRIFGHIAFSPVTITSGSKFSIFGLGPMAVHPEKQRTGIGSMLVKNGLDECRKLGAGAVIVLGHPEYYPNFGFTPASHFGLDCEYDVPENVFMATELEAGYLNGISGTVSYHPAFKNL